MSAYRSARPAKVQAPRQSILAYIGLAAVLLTAAVPYVHYRLEGHQLLDNFIARSSEHAAHSPPPEAKLDAAFFADLNSSYREPDGIVPRVKAHAAELYGPPAYLNPMCRAIRDQHPSHIALVGNGPLTQQDRADIAACDKVLRFNLMNNWKRFEEGVHVWVVRHSKEARKRYWGINNIKPPDAERIINSTQAVWLVGGTQEDADVMARSFPGLLRRNTTLLPLQPWLLTYAMALEQQGGWPSTGFVAISALRFCVPDATLHLFGMNWSTRVWQGHKIKLEEQWVQGLQRRGLVVVHPTACEGLRECGKADIDNSCHWSADKRYLCLQPERGRDGVKLRWHDQTDKVLAERVMHVVP